jgi:hypothetical protein
VVRRVDIEPLDLDRSLDGNQRRHGAQAQLDERLKSTAVLGDPCFALRIANLGELQRLGVMALAMPLHVRGAVRFFESGAKGPFRKHRKSERVTLPGAPNPYCRLHPATSRGPPSTSVGRKSGVIATA